jgi:hypothetical protein
VLETERPQLTPEPLRQAADRRDPALMQALAELERRAALAQRPLRERRQIRLERLEASPLCLELDARGCHFVRPATELGRQALERITARLELAEFGGIGIELGRNARGFAIRGLEGNERGVEIQSELVEGGMRRRPAHRGQKLADLAFERLIGCRNLAIDARTELEIVLTLGDQLDASRELGVFAGARGEALHGREQRGDAFGFVSSKCHLGAEALELCVEFETGGPARAIRLQHVTILGPRVEQRLDGERAGELPRGTLRRDQQPLSDAFAQSGERHALPIDARSCAVTSQHELYRPRLDRAFPVMNEHVEHGLGPRPREGGQGSHPTHQRGERGEEQRLARAGLARDDVQTRAEFERYVREQ